MNPTQPDELSEITQTSIDSITLNGRTFEVRPLVFRQIPPFLRHAAPIMPLLRDFARRQHEFDNVMTLLTSNRADWLAAIADHGEAMTRALAVATNQSEDDVGNLLPHDYLTLWVQVVFTNLAFFYQAGLGAMIGLPMPEQPAAPGMTASSC